MSDITLKAKLLAALRDELTERGACLGWFPEADGEGAYLMRADGEMRGVGAYQALDSGTIDDLTVRELAGVLSGLSGLSKDVALDVGKDYEFSVGQLTGDQLAWAQGTRPDYQIGARETLSRIREGQPLTPVTLATDTFLISRRRGQVVATRTFLAGTTFEQAQANHCRCLIQGTDVHGEFSFLTDARLVTLAAAPARATAKM